MKWKGKNTRPLYLKHINSFMSHSLSLPFLINLLAKINKIFSQHRWWWHMRILYSFLQQIHELNYPLMNLIWFLKETWIPDQINIHQILFKPVTKDQILNLSRKLTSWSHLTPREQKLTAITAFTAKRIVQNNKKRQEHEEHNQEMIRSQTFMHQKNHDEENTDKETHTENNNPKQRW